MKRRTAAIVAGILVIALASFTLTIAEANRSNTKAPCKALNSFLECSGHGKRALMKCLFNPISKWLKLTPEQKGTIEAILSEEIPDIQPLLQEAFANRKELEAITAEGRFVESEVRNVAQKQAAILVELIVIKEQVRSEIYPILTPEQRDNMKALRVAFDERLQELISR